ncbi:transport and Golgi organization protein 1 homolog isoform X1 [Ictidomys tridecemlineatus]
MMTAPAPAVAVQIPTSKTLLLQSLKIMKKEPSATQWKKSTKLSSKTTAKLSTSAKRIQKELAEITLNPLLTAESLQRVRTCVWLLSSLRKGYSYERVDGSVRGEERHLAIKNFGQQPIFVFLLSTRAGGVGMNLKAADTVIFSDSDFNPQNDLRAAARAHRIGQNKAVKVIRLIGRDTVEEIVYRKAASKLQLTNTIIERDHFTLGAQKPLADPDLQLSDILKFGLDKLLSSEGSTLEEGDLESILGETENSQWASDALPAAGGGIREQEEGMLMYRGEAVEDFTGPDCRFVNFKKGDPVFVYYKLAEVSPELWAGSVGRMFGYFPKDFIKVVREYTKEELQIPTDEKDFVCFDVGGDDFDNYNVEELLGFLELYDSANEDSEKAIEKVGQFPEVSQDVEPEPKPVVANSQQIESAFSENTVDVEEQFLAQKNHPHADSQTDNAQGEQTSLELFEEILPDKLKVPESEKNKTSNISQVSNEQEKTNAYKLLKKEINPYLETKENKQEMSIIWKILKKTETTAKRVDISQVSNEQEKTDAYKLLKKEINPYLETKENKQEMSIIWKILKKTETTAKRVDMMDKEREMQPPHEDDFPKENTNRPNRNLHEEPNLLRHHFNMNHPEEPSLLNQPVTEDMGVSEVSQIPNTEKVDPELLITEGTPVDAADTENQLEIKVEEPADATLLDNILFLLYSFLLYLSKMLFTTLPDDTQPGPDFYGLPWKPVVFAVFFGIVSFVIFSWRTALVKDRVYQVSEQQISKKVNNFMKENEELMQKLSNYEQKMKESKKQVQETMKQNMILSDEATNYKDKMKLLEKAKELLDEGAKSLHVMLESEREQKAKNQDLIMENKKSIEKLKDVISVNTSELSELQILLTEAKLREEKVKLKCCQLQKENTMLKKEKEQLQQEVKDWSTSHAELSEQMKSFEKTQKDLQVALSQKDDTIHALTNYITQLNRLQCESESEDQSRDESDELTNGELAGDRNEKIKDQIKQMMDVSQTKTTISVVEEDLKLLQLKLRASMSTKCNLEDQIKKLESDCNSLRSSKVGLEEECKTLRQKVEILNELYQQNEMALKKKVSQEEYERLEKEQRLSAADEKVVSAVQEVKNYKRRIEEMEEALQKTKHSFKNQIAMHEKKAHDNWLKARSAERAIAEEKREVANLRQKLLEMTQKIAVRQDEPGIVKPMLGRPDLQNPPQRDSGCGPAHMNSSSRSSSPAKVTNEGKVHMAMKGPPPFSGVPFMGPPMGRPPPPPIWYGPPLQLGGPFGPRPIPPPFGPGMRPPIGFREYAPGVTPGKWDLPFDPRDFFPGPAPAPFRSLGSFGPREYFIPGAPLPPPTHGPQDYGPPPAAKDLMPLGFKNETPPNSQE